MEKLEEGKRNDKFCDNCTGSEASVKTTSKLLVQADGIFSGFFFGCTKFCKWLPPSEVLLTYKTNPSIQFVNAVLGRVS